ncbi:unnamed protein product [Ilex paraguariensis]|uniref:SP-RING-type domain-containing protein n=1 Tax=Ilex paraguariensis TaxID=185542 RepID=A0ABC8RAE3_9AQUA
MNCKCRVVFPVCVCRFYPLLKMGQILVFLEVKPGYGTFAIDFHISKYAKPSPEDKIRLFVAQTDNIETSSCIISPPQVNFLLNGKGVERRTNVFMDTGPQIPTVVTPLLKYGTNLLQAVGEFNGSYIVFVAYMSVVSTPDCPALEDYSHPAIAALDSDSEIIEGPSRISINCPISFRRITTPIKGHSCKHLQCFDFDNYVDINSRRPYWRCPHCNQFVCFTDIRIDQNMVKVLKEVGENVADVIISADGSWEATKESEDPTDQPHDNTPNCKQDGSVHQESAIFPNAPPDVLDLTEGNDVMDAVGNEDRKPSPANCLSQSNTEILTTCLNTYHMNEVNENSSRIGQVSVPAPSNYMPSPVLTDAVSPALNREVEAFGGNAILASSVPDSQLPVPANLQVQQSQFGNSSLSNENQRFPSIPRHVSRTPIAVQALPVQNSIHVTTQRSRNSLNTLAPCGPSAASQSSSAVSLLTDGFNAASSNLGRQPQFSRSHFNPLQVSHTSSSSSLQFSGTQNWDHQNRSLNPGQTAQQMVGRPELSLLPGAYRFSPARLAADHNSNQHLPLKMRVPHAMGPSPSLVQSSAHFPRPEPNQGVAEQRESTGAVQPVDSPPEQNWRPTGRMRGSLSGRAYSDAVSQYIIRPTQPVQAARPLSNMTLPPASVPSHLQVLVANSRNAHDPQAANHASTEPACMSGSLGVLSP